MIGELAAARAETLRIVEPLTQAQLDFSPRPGRWSVGEVADHLLLSEGLYRGEIARLIELKRSGRRPYLKRSFADINVAPLHLPNALLPWLDVPFSMMSRFVPNIVRDLATRYVVMPTRNPDLATPRPHRPRGELRADLVASLHETRALIEANAAIDLRELVIEHPLTGASNVLQVLHFLAVHEQRHHGQIAGIRSDPRFP